MRARALGGASSLRAGIAASVVNRPRIDAGKMPGTCYLSRSSVR